MKDTTKKKLLQIIWDECSFDEIINAGFENNKCGAINLKVAADEFSNPNKEYNWDELLDDVSINDLDDIVRVLLDKFSLGDIIDSLGTDDILDTIDDNKLIDYLHDTGSLDTHDQEVEDEYHDKIYEELIEEACKLYEINRKELLNEIEDYNSDDMHVFICDILGIGYYDKKEFKRKWNDFLDKLNKNGYGIKYKE